MRPSLGEGAALWGSGAAGSPARSEEIPVSMQIGLDVALEELMSAGRKRVTAEHRVREIQPQVTGQPAGMGRTLGLLALAAVAAYFVLGELGVVRSILTLGG